MWARTLLDLLCASLPVVAFASPATVFLPAIADRSKPKQHAVEMPPLAITSQMLQCFLFGIYAWHFGMSTLLIPNAAGFSLGFLWSALYPFQVVPDEGLRQQWRAQCALSLLLMASGSLSVRTMPNLSATVAAAVGVVMCTYPLPAMRRAYAENNSKLMGSGAMNLAMFATCSAWVVHSSPLVEYDVFVLVSNAAGIVVQGSALVLRGVIAGRSLAARGEDAELSALTPLL
ncbi:hypothetical protein ACHAWF_009820 [Thalassiosira exigua]